MNKIELIIGNKNYSSWSLRPWLVAKMANLELADLNFVETIMPLFEENHRANFDAALPTGKVPLLRHNDMEIWESLAICEYINEIMQDAGLWPNDIAARAYARSVSTEMAAGFTGLRNQFPMNCRGKFAKITPNDAAIRDITRIENIWRDCRQKFGHDGNYLFGKFSIADAMFAPVVSRFKTYDLATCDSSKQYMKIILSLPAMKDWYNAALQEKWVITEDEI